MTPQERADQVRRLMFADDTTAQDLGMEILEMRPGMARLQMRIRPQMTNGHGICHGGYIFILADTAFAYSCNSHNQRAVAAGAQIDFVAPVHRDELLTAQAQEQHLAGRTGVYDVRVTRANGELVALFRGKSATIKGQFFEETAP